MKQTLNELKDIFDKPFLTIDEVGKLLHTPKRTIQQSIYSGRFEIPSFKINKQRMVRLVDIADYIDGQCAESAAEIEELN